MSKIEFNEKLKEYGFKLVSDNHSFVYHNEDWFGQDIEIHLSGKGGLLGSVDVKVKGVGNFYLGCGKKAIEFWSMVWKWLDE